MPEAILAVLRALIDAAFRAGAISDAVQAELHAQVDEHDPAVQAAPPPALTDAEQAELDRLQAKQAASVPQPEAPAEEEAADG